MPHHLVQHDKDVHNLIILSLRPIGNPIGNINNITYSTINIYMIAQ